jgi:hypothetical protein
VRVRIRRDVRMRRRDGKGGGGGGNDAHKADGEYARRQARTPERQQPIDPYRQRSLSATSEHGRIPYDAARRPSGPEYPAGPAPPPPSSYSHASTGNLNFGPQYAARTQVAVPQPSPTTPTFTSGRPSPMQTPPLPCGSRPIKAESPHPRQIPASPRAGHHQTLSNASLPPIDSLLAIPDRTPMAPMAPIRSWADSAIEPDDEVPGPGPPRKNPGTGNKRKKVHISSGGIYDRGRTDEEECRYRHGHLPTPLGQRQTLHYVGTMGLKEHQSGPFFEHRAPPYIEDPQVRMSR